MKNWNYYNPVIVKYSQDFICYIKEILNKHSVSGIRHALICYNSFVKTSYFEMFRKTINPIFIYSNIEKNPSCLSCQKAIDIFKDIKPNIIIAIGGGSVIDTAKVIRASLYKNTYSLEELFNKRKNVKNIPILIAIPTTHVTGSELTMWATVWDKKNKIKRSLSEIENYPTYAIYDVNLVKELPLELSIITTLDALSHAFESIWNKNNNPISTQYAIQAIKIIYENISKINHNMSLDTRRNLMMASMFAGLAFSNTETAVAHSISYPLTLYYNIPHGIACSITLYPIMELNYNYIKDDLYFLLKILGISNIDDLFDRIYRSIEDKIYINLRNYYIKKKDLWKIVDKSFTKERIQNNIRKLDKKHIRWILEKVF